MASDRPFPPSTRRLALARAAGLTPASPILVGAFACAGAAIALAMAARAMFVRLGASVHSALEAADGSALHAGTNARDVVTSIIALALPVLGAIAIAAVLAHLAQTRAVWIPRRRIPNAPIEDPQRGTRGAMAIVNAGVIALVAVGWLYAMAPRLAALVTTGSLDATSDAASMPALDGAASMPATGAASSAWSAGALLVISFLAALAIAWVALGAIDALVRYAAHTRSLRMTPEEQRADQRLAGADPRWRARREKLARGEPVRDAVAGASVLVLGDGVAVAVAWDPVRRPVPIRTASGRAARATQLLGLARRFAIAVHRDAELATLLATGDGPVPEAHWPRLAEVVAATRNRR